MSANRKTVKYIDGGICKTLEYCSTSSKAKMHVYTLRWKISKTQCKVKTSKWQSNLYSRGSSFPFNNNKYKMVCEEKKQINQDTF